MSGSASRVVWVTGASSGIGQACVATLVERGHRVVALGRRLDRLEALRDSLREGAVHAVACDVQDIEQVRRAHHDLPPAFAQVDTLINNAGLMLGTCTFDALAADAMHTMVMTNCMGVLHNTSVLLPSLKASGRGHIVNVTSIGAHYPYVTGHVYAATKAFVEHFGASLRPEHRIPLVLARLRDAGTPAACGRRNWWRFKRRPLPKGGLAGWLRWWFSIFQSSSMCIRRTCPS